MTRYFLAAAAAFALYATPAAACEGCHHDHGATAQADKKDDKGCHCKGADGKCQCGDKCVCEHCKAKSEKKDEPKKS